jgi:hypothetical protein
VVLSRSQQSRPNSPRAMYLFLQALFERGPNMWSELANIDLRSKARSSKKKHEVKDGVREIHNTEQQGSLVRFSSTSKLHWGTDVQHMPLRSDSSR